MEREAAKGLYAGLHEKQPFHDGTFTRWAEKRSPAFPYHYLDGVTVWVAAVDHNPDDGFTTDVRASPTQDTGAVAEQSPGDQAEADEEREQHRQSGDDDDDGQ
jgi:hypothetical protein